MKNLKLIIYIITLFFYTNISFGQNLVYADMDSIIKTSIAGKNIIVYFKKKNDELNDQLNKKKKIITEKEKSLLAQKNILEPDEYLKRINEIKTEINQFNLEYNKKIENLNFERDSVSKSFQIEINKVLKEFVEKNNIDIILSSNLMLVGKSNLDVTEKLLNQVNDKIKNFKINK